MNEYSIGDTLICQGKKVTITEIGKNVLYGWFDFNGTLATVAIKLRPLTH